MFLPLMKTICRTLHFSSIGFEHILHLGIFCARFYPLCGVTSHLGTSPATKPYRDFPQETNHIGTSPATKPYRDFPQETNHIGRTNEFEKLLLAHTEVFSKCRLVFCQHLLDQLVECSPLFSLPNPFPRPNFSFPSCSILFVGKQQS